MKTILVILLILQLANCDEVDEPRIFVQVNNISPYSNPVETYRYYMLPFCAPKSLFSEDQTFGQTLSGDRKMSSLYNFTLHSNITNIPLAN